MVDQEDSDPDKSIEALFGHLCSGTHFAYDEEVKEKIGTTRSGDGLTPSSSQRTSEPEISQTAEDAGIRSGYQRSSYKINQTAEDAGILSGYQRSGQRSNHSKKDAGILGIYQRSSHDQKLEARRVQSLPPSVEVASHASGEILPGTPKRLLREAHKHSPRVPFSLGDKSQARRVQMIQEAFERWPSASGTKAKTRSRARSRAIPGQEGTSTEVSSATHAKSSTRIGDRAPERLSQLVPGQDIRSSPRARHPSLGLIPSEGRRVSNVSRVSAPACDDEDDEMLEELFDSQSTIVETEGFAAQIRGRVEAYEAALDVSGMAWPIHSPIMAGNNHTAEELIL